MMFPSRMVNPTTQQLSRVASRALSTRTDLEEVARFALLRHPVGAIAAKTILKMPTEVAGVPNPLKAFSFWGMSQFAIIGKDMKEVLREAKKRGVTSERAIFDDPKEMIETEAEGIETAEKYSRLLETEGVLSIAVKPTGLCSREILEEGVEAHPRFQFMLNIIEALALRAEKLGKTIFIDAETKLIEDHVFGEMVKIAHKAPKAVYLTVQCLRRDSLRRLEVVSSGFTKEAPLQVKLVNGAYVSEIPKYRVELCQTKEETHRNYEKALRYIHKTPTLTCLPCTHNEGLIKLAKSLGHTEVGQLLGMNIAAQFGVKEKCYVVMATPGEESKDKGEFLRLLSAAKTAEEYFERRIVENSEHSRREVLVRTRLEVQWKQFLGLKV